ncbi:hypothetical protein HOV30_gp017 [Erwinia phage Derbicus]|uniref:SH3 fold domain-containing protein n=2 Tax=Derbicusvirus derbicus TaxID=2734104 RepID=A0A482IJ57_9CAUD|nr:hypothetical protein BIZ82_gp017 [Erwinia phage vB_EamM_EarlPhillipIV]YP_009821061.1 hypothetical protein HOV30_gp017 [Erwinia phage Derbicus]ANZ48867.1 hypothetical protein EARLPHILLIPIV_17 [Erwinia phage vB_EamM_EarlPhillipIV]QBP07443.1 hypothetical protein DERBICUS_17 [Erwinia phage Derbicus]QXO09738.1 hypothetical protein pEaSNUABM38_00016 [Erwinia phage pEa_SNUABM_38]
MFDISTVPHGSVVNITYDTPLLGTEQYVEVLGTSCGYKMAMEIEDVNAIHQNIYSSLEAQPTNNLTAYNFIVFVDSEGKQRVAADAWIRNITVVKKIKAQCTVEIDSVDEIEHIRKALAARGLNDVVITVIEVQG